MTTKCSKCNQYHDMFENCPNKVEIKSSPKSVNPPRKIVQISSATYDLVDYGVCRTVSQSVVLFALCDDGTIFSRGSEEGSPWKKVSSIPQD